MSIPAQYADYTQHEDVVITFETVVAFQGEDKLTLEGRNLAIVQLLGEAQCLTPQALAVAVVTHHWDIADVNDNGGSLPRGVFDSAMDYLQPLPADAKGRDLQDKLLTPDQTAGMLRFGNYMLDLREQRRIALQDADDEAQAEFFLRACLFSGAVSYFNDDAVMARYPLPFVRLCVAELKAAADAMEKLDRSLFSDLDEMLIETTDRCSVVSRRADARDEALQARLAAQADAAQRAQDFRQQMTSKARKFKL